MEVLIHVKGDREAVLKLLNKKNIKYKMLKRVLWIKNSYIYIDHYGEYGNRLCLYTDSAKTDEGKPAGINFGWGDSFMSFKDQVRIFNSLKRAIMQHRKEYYKKYEAEIRRRKAEHRERLKEISEVLDFEKKVLAEEHQLEAQLIKTIELIGNLQKDLPRATFSSPTRRNIIRHGKIDHGILYNHGEMLLRIILYLKVEEIEAVHILEDTKSPIQIEKEGSRVKIQKKHLKKLSVELNKFVREIKYFLKVWLRNLQITPEIRNHLRDFYEEILEIYIWYAELFKKEARK